MADSKYTGVCDVCGDLSRAPRRHLKTSPCRFCSQRCNGFHASLVRLAGTQPVRIVKDGLLPCGQCGERKPVEAFSVDRARPTGRHSYCKPCRSARRKAKRKRDPAWAAERMRKAHEWREANPEKFRAHMRTTQRSRRAQKLGSSLPQRLTTKQFEALAAQQGGRCWWCGEWLGERWHVDHVVPLSKGGAHELGNLRAACVGCNCRKHAQDPLEFAGRLF